MIRLPICILAALATFIFSGNDLHSAQMDAETLAVVRVQPLLKEKCLGCHGDDPDKIKSDYDMRTVEGILKGGESEVAAVVAKQPDQSPLYLSVLRDHDDWEAMPPKEAEALTAEQIAWIKDWIAGGAPWPDESRKAEITKNASKWLNADGVIVKTIGALNDDWANRRYKPEDLWAYQPVTKPKVDDSHAIDLLIEAALPDGLEPAPATDARTFIRRATFDLTGLPPTPEEIADFESAYASNSKSAVNSLIDRLLDSPHYGERMARHWLDVTRYADTSGLANDFDRGNAWRFRDYVVRAFNDDKPYDQFIKEQIAGDEINPTDPEMLVAAGFLRMGPWELTGMEVRKVARQRFLDDVTNAVGETFLAHSLQCARCHDHKFDPVPTHDYYSIQAVFATTQLAEPEAPFLNQENTRGFEEKAYLDKRRAEYQQIIDDIDDVQLAAVDGWYAEQKIDSAPFYRALEAAKKNKSAKKNRFKTARSILIKEKVPENQIPPAFLGYTSQEHGREQVARKGLNRLPWEYERYLPVAFSVYNGKTPLANSVLSPARPPENPMAKGELEKTAILTGGDPFSPGTPVKPAVLSAVEALNPACRAEIPDTPVGRRTAFANWIANPKNPLTTRAIVNRIWLWHFGQPIAGNPNNFGGTGKKPTHPELLDWLAATFVEDGWSFKEMHRRIMTSGAYQRSSAHPRPDILKENDPLGQSYAAFTPRRLTAEEIRDATLSATGELNPELGGIPVRPEMNQEVALQPRQVMGGFAAAWVPHPKPEQRHRRSIYVQQVRGLRDPFMEVFNEPGPDFSCEMRDASTVTPQVFSLFNSHSSANRSLALAHRLLTEDPGAERGTLIKHLFEITLNRPPANDEVAACLDHWRNSEAHHQATPARRTEYPTEISRESRAEKTGELFTFPETLFAYRDFVPDLQPADVDVKTRALAEVCLVLLNSNEFAYIY